MGMPEAMARAIFEAAIREERAGELLDCLFEGGTATVDAHTRKLVLLSGDMLAGLGASLEGDDG